MAAEPRQSQRVNAEVAVRLENRTSGVTRDISPNGVYFVIGETVTEGELIRFTLEFVDPTGAPLHLNCTGKVVRVEEAGGKRGIAVHILEQSLERRGSQAQPPEDERLVVQQTAAGKS